MSFALETENLVKQLIQAEYKNACKNWGEKYSSLHEGYAVLLEEVEEAGIFVSQLQNELNLIWKCIKLNRKKNIRDSVDDCFNVFTNNAIKELAQIGAVLMKIKNTLDEVEQ